jgi:thiamine pyrophosphokinase
MKRAALFLTGRYRPADIPLYKKLCRAAYKIAVDGGVRFFTQSGQKPDLVIGDFDSSTLSAATLKRRFPKAEIVEHPPLKDRTDCHLAVDLCLERKIRQIDIIQPSKGELDHLLGNLMLLEYIRREDIQCKGRLIGPNYEASLIGDEKIRINGCKGWGLSVVPLSKSIRLTSRGVAYPTDRLTVKRGDSRALRNELVANRATVAVEGEAYLIRLKRRQSPGRS